MTNSMVVITQNLDPGHLNNLIKKYCGKPPIKQGANGPGPRALHNATRKFQKNVVEVSNIIIFGLAALSNDASMEA
jgi:hypothetical protein